MDLAHHLDRSQRCLNWVPVNLADDDCARAADSLRRAASHAITAAAVHWGFPHHSRRRFTTVLYAMLHDGKIDRASHISTFRQVHELPAEIAAAPNDTAARRLIRRVRTRVRRLRNAVIAAVSAIKPTPDSDSNPNPNPPRNSAGAASTQNASLRAQLEAIAVTRPEVLAWIHQWPDLFGDPQPPADAPEWPNVEIKTTPDGGFRWPLPRA